MFFFFIIIAAEIVLSVKTSLSGKRHAESEKYIV